MFHSDDTYFLFISAFVITSTLIALGIFAYCDSRRSSSRGKRREVRATLQNAFIDQRREMGDSIAADSTPAQIPEDPDELRIAK